MKQNNSTLKNKLRNYSILAGSALAAASTADGQIVYHDINPDRIIVGNRSDTLHLDLNGDGIADYDLLTFINKTSKGAVNTQGAALNFFDSSAAIAATFAKGVYGDHFYLDAYSAGKVIGPKVNFYTAKQVEFSFNSKKYLYYPAFATTYKKAAHGKWANAQNKYLPLRVTTTGGNFYGWVRCSVSNLGDTLTVKDYAYQSIADSSIIAGDSGVMTGISSHQLQNISVYSSGKNVFVKYAKAQEGITVIVTDMQGKEVQSAQTTSELYEMNLENTASGIYTITVRSKEGEITKKVSIQ